MGFFSKIRSSLFVKLFIIMVGTGFIINLLVFGYFSSRFRFDRRHAFIQNLEQYTAYIINDIGIPPDTQKASQIAKKTGVAICIEGPGIKWGSSVTACMKEEFHHRHDTGNGVLAMKMGTYVFSTEKNGYTFSFTGKPGINSAGSNFILYSLLALLTAVLVLAYLAIRRLLAPIHQLQEAVETTGEGKLDHSVPVKRNDELGILARSYNRMTTRIKEMMTARDSLLLDVSHELRSPLTRLKVALELSDDPELKERLRFDIHDMEAMITEILETEKLKNPEGTLDLREDNPVSLLKDVITRLNVQDDEVTLHVVGEEHGIPLDASLMGRAFSNILSNALKYTPSENKPVQVEVQFHAGNTGIRFIDRGYGIPADQLSLVFEPFYRTDRSRSRQSGGYGLGLHLAKRIVEAHGGTITIQSREGEGTDVTIIL